LVVAHGAFMRALRADMGIERNIRTPNAVPVHCLPPRDNQSWTLCSATP
jgi:probable phosphoglycerate mutase